jgi:uncharacterized protein YkwD
MADRLCLITNKIKLRILMKQVLISAKLILLIACNLAAQPSDSKNYYSELTLRNFRKEPLFHEEIDFENIDYPRLHAAIFFVTNEERAKKKLSFLEYAPELEKTAIMHSRDMNRDTFFSHYNPVDKKKKTPNDRAAIAGILNPFLAENIATCHGLKYKSGTNVYIRGDGLFSYKMDGELIPSHTYLSLAEAVVDDWMNSKGHRKNILMDSALQLGCGSDFYRDRHFNNMPSFKVTQNFQLYVKIKSR